MTDEERFDELWRAHYAAVLGYARRRAPADVAQDVVCETFLVAWRRLDDLPGEVARRAWLLGVARRTLANARRGERRREALAERMAEQAPLVAHDPPAVADHGLDRALSTLSERERSPASSPRPPSPSSSPSGARPTRSTRRPRRPASSSRRPPDTTAIATSVRRRSRSTASRTGPTASSRAAARSSANAGSTRTAVGATARTGSRAC